MEKRIWWQKHLRGVEDGTVKRNLRIQFKLKQLGEPACRRKKKWDNHHSRCFTKQIFINTHWCHKDIWMGIVLVSLTIAVIGMRKQLMGESVYSGSWFERVKAVGAWSSWIHCSQEKAGKAVSSHLALPLIQIKIPTEGLYLFTVKMDVPPLINTIKIPVLVACSGIHLPNDSRFKQADNTNHHRIHPGYSNVWLVWVSLVTLSNSSNTWFSTKSQRQNLNAYCSVYMFKNSAIVNGVKLNLSFRIFVLESSVNMGRKRKRELFSILLYMSIIYCA